MADPDALVGDYFDAWNTHDGAALAGLFSDEGTYEAPTTDGPVPAATMPQLVETLVGAFPDVAFERWSMTGAGPRRVVEWVLRGHNQGPLGSGTNPTGRAIALRGVDAFEFDRDGVRAVRRYFDQKALVEQTGLMALVQPFEQGPARYGYSMRVPSGNGRPPGIIALTWIQGANEAETERIRAHSRLPEVRNRAPGTSGILVRRCDDCVHRSREDGLEHARHLRRVAVPPQRHSKNGTPGVA